MWNKQPTKYRFVAYASILLLNLYLLFRKYTNIHIFWVKGNVSAAWKIDQNLIIIKTSQALTYQANKENTYKLCTNFETAGNLAHNM